LKILSLDTSTEACSAAILQNDEVQQEFIISPREHTKLILPMVERLLAEAGLQLHQLDSIAFGRGPGSFTGLRIGAGIVQGLAYGAGLPVIPISTLKSLAYGYWLENLQHTSSDELILTALDARMNEVYWAGYKTTVLGVVEVLNEQVVAPENIVLPKELGQTRCIGMGSGWLAYETLPHGILSVCDNDVHPEAQYIALLGKEALLAGETVSAEQAMPVYLRNEVTWKKRHEQ